MADTHSEYFNIGSIVKCTTCFNEEIKGEVLAFDQQVKILTLSILLLKPACRHRPKTSPTFKLINFSFHQIKFFILL